MREITANKLAEPLLPHGAAADIRRDASRLLGEERQDVADKLLEAP